MQRVLINYIVVVTVFSEGTVNNVDNIVAFVGFTIIP